MSPGLTVNPHFTNLMFFSHFASLKLTYDGMNLAVKFQKGVMYINIFQMTWYFVTNSIYNHRCNERNE